MKDEKLNVLFLSAEAVPFAKVGGLADVAGALPKALRSLGHDVRLMIPRYGSISSEEFSFEKIGKPCPVPCGPGEEQVHLVHTTTKDGVPVYLVWDEKYFYARERVYGFDDDPQRFALFGRAVISSLPMMGWTPDVIHANDWHTAVVPTWLAYEGIHLPEYRHMGSLFTIHNLAYQGTAGRLILTFGQMEYVRHLSVEQPGQVNWMAQGIANSDLVSTVSKQYAKDILKPEAGSGLDPLLKERKDRLHGVVNGIDYDLWNPATDPHIAQHFDRSSLKMRAVNKAALQQEARLPTRPDTPLIGMVTRLDYLKGIDLLQPVLSRLLEGDIQFVILGTGTEEYHEILEGLQSRYSDKMRAFLRYDDPLARRIYAGSDIFLMPSRFEPCGLGQMIAMHYGAVPVVHRTGGLSDTVTDYDQRPNKATGFVLSPLTPKSLTNGLERALDVFRDRDAWTELQKRGMKTDFSWQASAKKYVKLYRQIVELRHKV